MYITDRRFDPRADPSFTVRVYSNANLVDLKLNSNSLGSQASSSHLFQGPVVLAAGSNVIEAIGTRGTGADPYVDQVTWTLGDPLAVPSV